MAISSAKLGRNDVCSCGSGKKFKRCCGNIDVTGEDASSRFFGIAAMGAGLMLLAALAVGAKSLIFDAAEPDGRVWSAEHGHYHNANGGELGAGGPGKVWNEEHGHYHDAPKPEVPVGTPTPVQGALEGLRSSELDAAARDQVAPTEP